MNPHDRFVSYAQNCEDVVLWRALRNIEGGFYVDVGAQDPVVDSVTKAFYDRGWRGINIEATEEYFAKLSDARPRDINLHAFASDKGGVVKFYAIPATGLSTAREAYAHSHADAGFASTPFFVPSVSLTDVLETLGPEEIHFLKIDVEGAELAVLQGLDLARFRPWILILEAMRPVITGAKNAAPPTSDHLEWEELVTSRGYGFAYADGLNRFYVANERWDELAPALAIPPNVFDDWIHFREVMKDQLLAQRSTEIAAKTNELATRTAEFTTQTNKLARKIDELGSLCDRRHTEINQIFRSIKTQMSKDHSHLTMVADALWTNSSDFVSNVKSLKMKKAVVNAEKALTDSRRCHFGKSNLKLSDPDPRINWFKRLFINWLRPRDLVTKGLFSALSKVLEALWIAEERGEVEIRETKEARERLATLIFWLKKTQNSPANPELELTNAQVPSAAPTEVACDDPEMEHLRRLIVARSR